MLYWISSVYSALLYIIGFRLEITIKSTLVLQASYRKTNISVTVRESVTANSRTRSHLL